MINIPESVAHGGGRIQEVPAACAWALHDMSFKYSAAHLLKLSQVFLSSRRPKQQGKESASVFKTEAMPPLLPLCYMYVLT